MTKKIIVALANALNEDLKLERLQIYCKMLGNLDEQKLKLACKNIINTRTKFPMISEIKEEYYNLEVGNDLANQEWSQVLEMIRKYGYYQQDKILDSLRPITRKVVERLGIERLCLMESKNISMERRMFVDTFNDLKNNNKREFLTTNQFPLLKNESKKLEGQTNE